MRNFSNVFLIAAIAGCAIAAGFGIWSVLVYPAIRSEMSYEEKVAADYYWDAKTPKPQEKSRPVTDPQTEARADAQINSALNDALSRSRSQQPHEAKQENNQLQFASWNVESGGNDPETSPCTVTGC